MNETKGYQGNGLQHKFEYRHNTKEIMTKIVANV